MGSRRGIVARVHPPRTQAPAERSANSPTDAPANSPGAAPTDAAADTLIDSPADVGAAKAALRHRLRAQRRTLAVDGRGEALAGVALTLPEISTARVVAAYIARSGEPATVTLLRELAARGVRVLLPVLEADLDLQWAVDDGTREDGIRAGLLEPAGPRLGREAIAAADVVLVPALGVDGSGARIGQGGGSYDRALARARPGALVVALLHDEELLSEPVPLEAHDRLVDAVVTPTRVVRFARDAGPGR